LFIENTVFSVFQSDASKDIAAVLQAVEAVITVACILPDVAGKQYVIYIVSYTIVVI
jgi:hypothetical protein